MPPAREDLTGQTFGALRVLAFAGIRGRAAYWRCICQCSRVVDVKATRLRRHLTQDCGCLGYRRDPARHAAARAKVGARKRKAIARKGAAARWKPQSS